MLILVLESSGNKNGSSNMLAKEFIRGAKDAGHDVIEFDVINADIRPCRGCQACGMNGPCAQQDDYEHTLKDLIKSCDMIVFTMPVYYYNWPAQMKNVIDRFYSFNGELTMMRKKTVFIVAGWDSTDASYACIRSYYQQLCRYLDFQDQGMVIGRGCGTTSMTARSKHLAAAYDLGKGL